MSIFEIVALCFGIAALSFLTLVVIRLYVDNHELRGLLEALLRVYDEEHEQLAINLKKALGGKNESDGISGNRGRTESGSSNESTGSE